MNNQDFQTLKDTVPTDSRGRITLGAVAKEKSYRVLVNDAGQILLDPVVSIPARELWLRQNRDALHSIQRGVQQSDAGEIHDLGSFSQFAELEIEE